MKIFINVLITIGFLDSLIRYTDKNIKLGYKITYAVVMLAFICLLIWFNG